MTKEMIELKDIKIEKYENDMGIELYTIYFKDKKKMLSKYSRMDCIFDDFKEMMEK